MFSVGGITSPFLTIMEAAKTNLTNHITCPIGNILGYALSSDGILLSQFSSHELFPLREEINNMMRVPEEYTDAAPGLAGHIEKEYDISPIVNEYLETLVMPVANQYIESYPNYLKKFNILSAPLKLYLHNSWVNFQKKYEFQPLHNHNGVFSFVIWMQIPYNSEIEKSQPWAVRSNCPCPGEFEIFCLDTTGGLRSEKIPVDKRYENHILFFPSAMYHAVYPFYTSDDYRISISGNIKLKVPE